VYIGDEKVIDLVGNSINPTTPKHADYNEDSLQIICSNGKSVAAICLALLKDQGLLNYEEKVATYWPEFA